MRASAQTSQTTPEWDSVVAQTEETTGYKHEHIRQTMMSLELKPISQADAFSFINLHHSHHRAPRGDIARTSVWDGEKTVGVITIGRPVARHLDDGWTAEVTRCCTDGTKNTASMLYGAACRMARAMGYRRLITYTLKEESGTSLVAVGWKKLYDTPGKSWNVPSRPRVDKHPIGQKSLWEAPL